MGTHSIDIFLRLAKGKLTVFANSENNVRFYFEDAKKNHKRALKDIDLHLVFVRCISPQETKDQYDTFFKVLWPGTTLRSFDSLNDNREQMINAKTLIDELNMFIDDQKLYLLIAVDKFHLLTSNQKIFLSSLLKLNENGFGSILIMSENEFEQFKINSAKCYKIFETIMDEVNKINL